MSEEIKIPEMGQKEIDLAARIFCLALINSEAETMTMTQEGFNGYGQVFGDFVITVKKKVDKRNPEIQALWEYGLEIGFTETKQHLQRFALKRLLAKHQPDKLRIAAEYAASIKSDRYAPQVNSWMDLEEKYLKLRDYVARQQQKPKTINLDVL
jgi:hypothetical protein